MEEEIEFGPEGRRGEQQARYGQGAIHMLGLNRKGKDRLLMTPNQLAAWKLNQALENYPIFTREARDNIQKEFENMEGIRTMNMKVLAATLSFLQSINNNVILNNFNDAVILPHLSLLLPDNLDTEKRKRLIIRFKAQILIYIRAILNFREIQ